MSNDSFPLYMSPSQISTLLTCGEQYRLTRKLHVPERPMWAGIGGSAVHRMTEDHDKGLDVQPWQHYWDEAFDEAKTRSPEFDPSEYYRSGRVSKAWPDKEDPAWWAENGPRFVESWKQWVKHCGFDLWECPDADGVLRPAVEVEVWYDDGTLSVRSIIDRVFVDQYGHLYIVDLKSGSHTDPWPRQLALNSLGLRSTFDGINAEDVYGGFWKARTGGVESWTWLGQYPDDWLIAQVGKARLMRDLELFVAQPTNLCNSACGVRQYCVAMGGKAPLDLSTMQQSHQEGESE